jgi:hypothetical protein
MNRRNLLSLAAALLLFVSTALAQFSSNIQGIVEDATKARVPDAKVTIRNVDTGITQESNTSNDGYYRFSSLQPGKYELKVDKTGFQVKSVELTLGTGQTSEVNLALAVGGSTTEVQVTEAAPVLDTADSRVQVTLKASALRDMPIQGRNFLSLVAVAPGVTGIGSPGGDNFANEATPDISGNGRNATGNTYTLDGLSVNSNITSGTTNTNPNPDTIQEMAIQTNNFTVDQGSTSSVVVSMTTKSGTNDFHGTGSYYFTNQSLRARTVFTGSSYEPFKKHDLSATFGGPIIKNKTFAFASVQPLRSATASGNSSTTTESAEFVAWAKGKYPDSLGTKLLSTYTPGGITKTGVEKYASDLYPATCNTAATNYLPCNMAVIDNGVYNTNPYRNGLQYSVRLDQYLRESKERFYFNYNRMTLDTENSATRSSLSSTNASNSRAVQAAWAHTFSPTLLNEFSFGGSMVYGYSVQDSQALHVPDVNVTGMGTGISPGWSGMFTQHNYNWKDVVSWVRGSHSLKFGGQFSWGDDWADFSGTNRPSFTFNSLLDLVQDNPYSESGILYNPLTGDPALYIFGAKITTFNFFVQDEWKVRPNLTLTLGVRYEDFGNAIGIKGLEYTQLYLASGSGIDAQMADASLKSQQSPFDGRQHAFSPRLGYAWSPGKSGKWSVRGGVGMYHDGALLGESVDKMRSNPPGYLTPTFTQNTATKPIFSIGTSDTYPFGFTLPTVAAASLDSHGGLVGTQPDIGATDRTLPPSSTVNYVVGLERQLAGRTVVGVNYVGSRTWDGYVSTNFNRVAGDLLDGTLNRLNSSFGSIDYVFAANAIHYNGMVLTLRKEMNRGSFQASYTLSKTTDLYQGGARSNGYESSVDQHTIYDENLRDSLRSDASWDHRHRFSLSGTYELPTPFASSLISKRILGGWQVALLGILQSGAPFSVYNGASYSAGGDYNADGTNYDYPNVSGAIDNSHTRSEFLNAGIFSLSQFTTPAAGTEGNEKRNQFRNPNYINFDASMIKNNRLFNERVNLQLKFEFFNVLNRVNLGDVDANLSSSTFGKVTSTHDPRSIQLGARISF